MAGQEQTSAPVPAQDGATSLQIDPQMLELLKRQATGQGAPKHLQEPIRNPMFMAEKPGEAMKSFIPIVGSAMQETVKAKKQAEVDKYAAIFQQLDAEWVKAQQLAGGDEQKASEMYKNSPIYKTIFNPSDPKAFKILKEMQQVFIAPWLDDGGEQSPAVAGFKRHTQLKGAENQAQFVQKMQQQFEQMKQAQPAPPPDPKVMESLLNSERGNQQFHEAQAQRHQEHVDNMQRLIREHQDRMDMMEQMMDLRRDNAEATKQYREQMVELRKQQMEMTREMMQARIDMQREKLEMGSKLPVQLANRVAQADIIADQIDDMVDQLKDPELRKYIGPAAGHVTGITGMFKEKVRTYNTAKESLAAMQAILHGYRGGQNVHEIFSKVLDPGAKPDVVIAGLQQLRKLTDNVKKEARESYPHDPVWKARDDEEKAKQQDQLKSQWQ